MTETIDLIEAERDVLTRLLEQTIGELRVEVRRTRTPDFHDRLADEEKLLKGLLAKLRES
ncbi:MAG: hypothetical protein ACYTJ0_05980 [Planctomycetota bacterium]|jgi:hypothetical protein